MEFFQCYRKYGLPYQLVHQEIQHNLLLLKLVGAHFILEVYLLHSLFLTHISSITNANSFDVDILSEVNDTILNMPASATVTEDDIDPSGSQNHCTGCTFFQELFGIRYLGFAPILPHELSAVSQMAADRAINPLSLGRTFASG